MTRRRAQRIPVTLKASFVLEEITYHGVIRNVSADGIGCSLTITVSVKKDFRPVKILDLQFHLPSGDRARISAELVWFARSAKDHNMVNLGLRVIEPPSYYRDFVTSLYKEEISNKTKKDLINELLEANQRLDRLEERLQGFEQSETSPASTDDTYRTIVEATDDSIYIVDRNYQYLFMNQKHLSRLGLSENEYRGHVYRDFHSFTETDEFIKKVDEVFHRGVPILYENISSRNNKHYLLTMSPIKTQGGEITAVAVISKDITDRKFTEELLLNSAQVFEKQVHERTLELIIANENLNREITERKQTEEALKKAAADWRITFDSTQDIILMTNKDYEVIKANKAASEFFHKSYEEIIGLRFPALFAAMGITDGKDLLERVKISKRHEEIEFHLHERGIWVLASADPIFDDRGSVAGAVYIIKDISEQKSLQLQLLQAQKMESIGRLAGGIAHDFNNLLSSIIGYAELTLLKLPADSMFKEYLSTIKEAGEKAAILTQRLLAFSRKQLLQMQAVNMNSVVENLMKMTKRMLREDIVLKVRAKPSICAVWADRLQIEQVLMNLMLNAQDAMPDGGTLIIETATISLEDNVHVKHENVKPGQYMLLTVSDTGIGMDKEVQNKLFEPFFTTKPLGKGTGLGLSTVYGIIKQHHGYIYVYSEIGKGTTFRIYLPISDAEQEQIVQREQVYLEGGNETVLVVDDDQSLRKLVKDILFPLGYRLLFAEDGKEALQVAKQAKEHIDVLLTDVIMPNMNGKELAALFHMEYPETKIIFISGYTDETIMSQGILDPQDIFMQKPLSPSTLTSTLRSVLEDQQ
jgi:PAS domain S-box-containing protein